MIKWKKAIHGLSIGESECCGGCGRPIDYAIENDLLLDIDIHGNNTNSINTQEIVNKNG